MDVDVYGVGEHSRDGNIDLATPVLKRFRDWANAISAALKAAIPAS